MKRFKQFLTDIWQKEFWSFTFLSRLKKLRFFLTLPFVMFAVYLCITSFTQIAWKIGGTLICLGWLVIYIYQFYSSYYRCKYELNWDIPKFIEEEKAKK